MLHNNKSGDGKSDMCCTLLSTFHVPFFSLLHNFPRCMTFTSVQYICIPRRKERQEKRAKRYAFKKMFPRNPTEGQLLTQLDTTRSHAYFLLQSSQERLLLLKHFVTQCKNQHSISEKDREKEC